MWLLRILLWVILAAPPLVASAQESRRLVDYVHQRWIEGSEAPVPVIAMAQGRDGYLWLATGDGLFRFDGSQFESIRASDDGNRKHDLPSALLVTRSGDVWTNFESSRRFAVYSRGALRILDTPAAPTRITQMVEAADGSIWALTANYDAEVLQLRDGHWRAFNAADGLPESNAVNMLVAADGAIWIATGAGVARLPPGGVRFEIHTRTDNARLSQDPVGRIWVSGSDGSHPVTGPGGTGSPTSPRAHLATDSVEIRGAPMFDHEGNLWLATRYGGVARFAMPAASPAGGAVAETFTSRDGLSSDVTIQMLEDREGNIWVGTERGLDKFRRATLIAEPVLSSPAVYGDKLLDASDGSVYIGQSRTIFRVRPGGVPEAIVHDVVEPQSLCEAPDGALWIGLPMQILVWARGSVRQTIERPDKGANHNVIYDCTFDSRGDYWISAAGSGVHRYRRGQWQTVLEPGDRPDFYPTTMVRTPAGDVVVQAGNRLVWLTESGQVTMPLDFGAGDLKVLTLYSTGKDVFAAGAFGLSRYRSGRVDTAWTTDASQVSRINGVVQTPDGDTWLAYPRSLVRLRMPELERAFNDMAFPLPSLSLGPGDGLGSRPHSHSQRSMVRGGDGRLWIATETGTFWMDPARIVRNHLPPGLAIKALDVDGQLHRDPTALRLAAATAKIEIDFAALSFADPSRVRVLYMLEGFDQNWVDPGTRRQAFYTNLAPGKYRFRVIAANNDGVWNRKGATLGFEIPPTFFQSLWFLLLCTVLVIAGLWGLYRLRVAQISSRIRGRLEERIAERERIARELHDTLLQGVQGLILRFHAVADRLPHEEKAKGQLEAALAAADDVVVDARNRVRGLRGDEGTQDLCAIIERLVADTPFDPPIPVRVVVEGRQRPMNPLVVAEVTRIVREAMLNIAHHAHASSAEIAIGFERRYLAIRVRDRGVGIPGDVLLHGHKDGHFGLVGMRERAEKIGGAMTISSSPGSGSEVMLTLPAKLAFARPNPRRRAWLPRFLQKVVIHE